MKRCIILTMMALICAGPAWAAETKIGYIDMQRTLNLSDAGAQAKNQLQEKLKGYQTQINAKQEELQKLKNDLERQGMALTESARAAKEKDYQQKLKDFQRFTKDAEDELQARDGEFTKKILEILEKIITDYGKKNGYTLIITHPNSGVLYADQKIDLTDAIMKELNAATKAKK